MLVPKIQIPAITYKVPTSQTQFHPNITYNSQHHNFLLHIYPNITSFQHHNFTSCYIYPNITTSYYIYPNITTSQHKIIGRYRIYVYKFCTSQKISMKDFFYIQNYPQTAIGSKQQQKNIYLLRVFLQHA